MLRFYCLSSFCQKNILCHVQRKLREHYSKKINSFKEKHAEKKLYKSTMYVGKAIVHQKIIKIFTLQ